MPLSNEHHAFCMEVLAAVRELAERRDLRVERAGSGGEAVQAIVSACARAAFAVAKAADAEVKAVCVTLDEDGEIAVFVADEKQNTRDVIVR